MLPHLRLVPPPAIVSTNCDNACLTGSALEGALALILAWATRAAEAEYLLERERRECARLRLQLESLL